MSEQIKISMTFFSATLSVAEMSAAAGFDPDVAADVNLSHSGRPVVRDTAYWTIGGAANASDGIDRQSEMKSRLTDNRNGLLLLRRVVEECQLSVVVRYSSDDPSPGFVLDNEWISLLYDFEASLNIEIYPG